MFFALFSQVFFLLYLHRGHAGSNFVSTYISEVSFIYLLITYLFIDLFILCCAVVFI